MLMGVMSLYPPCTIGKIHSVPLEAVALMKFCKSFLGEGKFKEELK